MLVGAAPQTWSNFRRNSSTARLKLSRIYSRIYPTSKRIDLLEDAVLASSLALAAWNRAGLLQPWVQGSAGYPKLIVGPAAWAELESSSTERKLYQEAFEQCKECRIVPGMGLEGGYLVPSPIVDIPPTGNEQVQQIWQPGLEILAVASATGAIVCADDLFYHAITANTGLLHDSARVANSRIQIARSIGSVRVMTSERLLRACGPGDLFTPERLDEIAWCLCAQGYRGTDLAAAARHTARQGSLSLDAVPAPIQAIPCGTHDGAAMDASRIEPPKHGAVLTLIALTGYAVSVVRGLFGDGF